MGYRRLKRWAAAGLAALGLLASAGGAAAQADARYGVYVQDEADVLSAQTEQTLYAQARWLHDETGTAQVGVVTVAGLDGQSLEAYAVARFRDMGLGSQSRNDGVLLLYTQEENRVRLEVGYGLEGRIPDGKAGAILDQYFVPNRDQGNLDAAFFQTQSAIIREVAAEYGLDAPSIGSPDMPSPDYGSYGDNGESLWNAIPWPLKAIAAVGIVFLLILDFKFTGGAVTWALLSMLGRGRGSGGSSGGGWGGRGGGGSSGGGGASR